MTTTPTDQTSPDRLPPARKCGRPTKSGAPCKQQLNARYEVACGMHATDIEKKLTAAQSAAWSEGFHEGADYRTGLDRQEMDRLRQRVAELEQATGPPVQYKIGHDQIVQVGKYSYRWAGTPPLEIGDRVWVPENYVSRHKVGPGPYVDTITSLGTTYTGELSRIISRAEDKPAS